MPTPSVSAAPENRLSQRVRGLDTIRFFLALWVVLRHFDLPLNIDESHASGKILSGLANNLFSGPAAVIVFFVISGFCIHYPFRHDKRLVLLPYFARRHLRIWPPILVAIVAANQLEVKMALLQDSILWSLIAEEIYYLLYPGLLFLKRKIGWKHIVIAAYIGASLVILRHPTAKNYPSYGTTFNWLLGLPCWLLGCVLAEKSDALRVAASDPGVAIWRWRLAAWVLSSVCSALKFHTPLGMPWTLTIFAVFAYFWLQQEIVYNQTRIPSRFFESLGQGSYSIYLTHLLGSALFLLLSVPTFNPVISWLLKIAFTLLVCCVFYWLVERPSHLVARRVAERLSRQSAPQPVSQVA